MKVTIELEKEDLACVHDVALEALSLNLNDEQVRKLFNNLPEELQGLAVQWGVSDTAFRDDLFAWLEEHREDLVGRTTIERVLPFTFLKESFLKK